MSTVQRATGPAADATPHAISPVGGGVPPRHAVSSDGYVPVIDLSRLDTATGWRAASSGVDAAARRSGFYLITGHSVAERAFQELLALALEFFHLTPDEKRPYQPAEGDELHRGWMSTGNVSAAYGVETGEDAAEVWAMVSHGEPGWRSGVDDMPFLGFPNRFPSVEFRAAAVTYHAAMEAQARVLLALHACALGLERDHFVPLHREALDSTVINYYPEQTSPVVRDDVFCKGPHTDWGTLTLLWHSGEPGLQVVDRLQPGAWVEVPTIPGAIVVNCGDLFSLLTGGRYASSLHRVECPVGEAAHERVSMPLFMQPGPLELVGPLPNCPPPDDSAEWEQLTYGEYMRRKLQAAFGER